MGTVKFGEVSRGTQDVPWSPKTGRPKKESPGTARCPHQRAGRQNASRRETADGLSCSTGTTSWPAQAKGTAVGTWRTKFEEASPPAGQHQRQAHRNDCSPDDALAQVEDVGIRSSCWNRDRASTASRKRTSGDRHRVDVRRAAGAAGHHQALGSRPTSSSARSSRRPTRCSPKRPINGSGGTTCAA